MVRYIKQVSLLWLLFIALLLATAGVWQASRWAYQVELQTLIETGEERLTLYTGTLRGALSRYAYLPYVLSHNSAVQELLSGNIAPDKVNFYLENLNHEAGCQALYVMNTQGTTLASSNWNEPLSYVGQNYGFRPYFTAAREKRRGQFFAIGVTTGQPGFFMSHPVEKNGQFLGVSVVKVDLTPLQEDWREGGELVLVSDVNGVLFLSSRTDWTYSSISPLSAEQRERIRAGRQYGNEPLNLAPFQTVEQLDTGRILRVEQRNYLMLSRSIPGFDWTLFHLAPLDTAYNRTQTVATTGTILVLLLLAVSLYARERRQKKLSRQKAHEAEAIKQVNLRLKEEIEEHRHTEQVLRETQAELVQNSKLAALGQLAAGIVHELNQPIAAIRTHTASARLLLDREERGKLRETFTSITRITEHMASITAQLKSFAHKTPRQREKVIMQTCLESALNMTAPLLSEAGVSLKKNVPREPLTLRGSSGQIEQVLVNLIRNGVDAMRDSQQRQLQINIATEGDSLELQISDSGEGIADENLPELFNPFFTTKEVGQGLGLGLSISYRIVTDLGGTIRATNNADGGANFIVRLPLCKEKPTGEQG